MEKLLGKRFGPHALDTIERGPRTIAGRTKWMALAALPGAETIALRRLNFDWRAWPGWLGLISVVDQVRKRESSIEVRSFGFLRLARVKGGAAATKGEIMRYWPNSPGLPTRFSVIPSSFGG